jgi:carboxypeptidase C (cathepsin A)
MPVDPALQSNITIKNYASGHMVYLDDPSRTAVKADLAAFYDGLMANRPALKRVLRLQRPPAVVPQ